METMHAIRAHSRGGPEHLVYEEAPRPQPGPGEVLVAVHAASLTHGELGWDATWTDQLTPGGRDRTPIIPAHEVSGAVAGLGGEVTGFKADDEVYGLVPFVRDGAAAEYVAVPADVLATKPASVGHVQAAAVPMTALTAWQALADHAHLAPGQHVLIHGGAGGIGSAAVQIATALGATVSATAAARDAGFVTGLGAHKVIDYARQRFEEHVSDVDVVIDLVGGDTQARSWTVLRPGGILVGIAEPPSQEEAARHGVRGVFFIVEPDRAELTEIARLVDAGRLRPVIDRVVPLEQAREAYEAVEHGHVRGKIVIGVAGR